MDDNGFSGRILIRSNHLPPIRRVQHSACLSLLLTGAAVFAPIYVEGFMLKADDIGDMLFFCVCDVECPASSRSSCTLSRDFGFACQPLQELLPFVSLRVGVFRVLKISRVALAYHEESKIGECHFNEPCILGLKLAGRPVCCAAATASWPLPRRSITSAA